MRRFTQSEINSIKRRVQGKPAVSFHKRKHKVIDIHYPTDTCRQGFTETKNCPHFEQEDNAYTQGKAAEQMLNVFKHFINYNPYQ